MAKLDEVGILSGARVRPVALPDLMPAMPFYLRFSLFNPDRLFTRMAPYLRWMWTPGFVVFSLLLMFVALLLSLMNPMEMASYGIYTVREHYLALFCVGMLVGFSHEFAHGLTCKVFGGRVTEVGALLIYYFIPGLYCNVSGMRLIPQRSRRLWVIAAGVYWQVLVGVIGLLAWFLFAPYTLMADVAFIFFLSSVVDVVFNANPLSLTGFISPACCSPPDWRSSTRGARSGRCFQRWPALSSESDWRALWQTAIRQLPRQQTKP
jgi:hypothetical protein